MKVPMEQAMTNELNNPGTIQIAYDQNGIRNHKIALGEYLKISEPVYLYLDVYARLTMHG